MSAIAGILFFHDAPVPEGLIGRLTSAMQSRGPDEQTHWMKASTALGQCMLRTTPESLNEHQPLVGSEGNQVLVWDGRLDNREELKLELRRVGATIRNNSDAELVLHSYATWGETCPKHILGEFAFAIWDNRKKHLFCARDHLGSRSLCFFQNQRFFALATEPEALLKLEAIPRQLNEDAFSQLIEGKDDFWWAGHTLYKDIHFLHAGSSLCIDTAGKKHIHRYWTPHPLPPNKFSSPNDLKESFQSVFDGAVASRLRSLSTPSLMLSGGIDSSMIATTIYRLTEGGSPPLSTYSVVSSTEHTCRETACINYLASLSCFSPNFIPVPLTSGSPHLENLQTIAWDKPHPVINSILLPTLMANAAAKDGHNVMLHEASGDLTMWNETLYTAEMIRSGSWLTAWSESRQASQNNTYLKHLSGNHIFFRSLISAAKQLLKKNGKREPASRCLKNLGHAERYAKMIPLISSTQTGYALSGGRYGVEMRDPWADKRVIDFFLALPLDHKVHCGWTKYPARLACADSLPPSICYRTDKDHLGYLLHHDLVPQSRDTIAKLIEKRLYGLDKYLSLKPLFRAVESLKDGDKDQCSYILRICALALWKHQLEDTRPYTSD